MPLSRIVLDLKENGFECFEECRGSLVGFFFNDKSLCDPLRMVDIQTYLMATGQAYSL